MKKLSSLVIDEAHQNLYNNTGIDAIYMATSVANSYQKTMASFAGSEAIQRAVDMASSYQKTMASIAGSEAMLRAVNMASSYQKVVASFAGSEVIQRAAEMASSYQKTMASIAGSEAMQRAVVMASSYQKAAASFAGSDAMQKAIDMASSYQKTMASIAGSEAMQRATSTTSSYQQTIAEIMKMSSFRNAIDAFAEPSNLWGTLDAIARAEKNIFVDGLSETELASVEVERQLQEVGDAKSYDSFAKAFSKLSPTIKVILIFVIAQLLAITQNIVANIVAPHVEKLISRPEVSERAMVKQLKAFSFDDLDVTNLRFVTTGYLLLRESPSSKSAVEDELRFGQIVTMVNKRRNWMEISYTREDGQIMHGWVFSRYTEKFKK